MATTIIGAVAQPGNVVLTLEPRGQQLYDDVNINNDDVGFVQVSNLRRPSWPRTRSRNTAR